MTSQLKKITDNFGTNELVRTNTHNKSLTRFATKINQLIHLFKQDQQYNQKRELELKQEITNISHDLRTPLTSIKGFSELLTDPSISEKEKQDYLAIIQKKIDNVTLMVDLFYELSKLDSSDNQLTMEKLMLDQIVIETMLMFYDEFEKRKLNVQVGEEVTFPVFADKKATRRIVTNIIQNALSYAKSYVTVNLIEKEDFISLRVVNDVDMFDPKEIHRIFDRTFRLDPSRTGEQFGLGLHIVEQLVNKQEGNIIADIQDNTFIIEVSFKKWN